MLGRPQAALSAVDQLIKDAHEIGHTATLMYSLFHAAMSNIWCGSFSIATNQIAEGIAVADEKQSLFWNSILTIQRGCVFVLTGNPMEAVQTLMSGLPHIALREQPPSPPGI